MFGGGQMRGTSIGRITGGTGVNWSAFNASQMSSPFGGSGMPSMPSPMG